MDYTEEERSNVEMFTRLSDQKLDTCPATLLTPLLEIVNCCTKEFPHADCPVPRYAVNTHSVHNIMYYYNLQVLNVLESVEI